MDDIPSRFNQFEVERHCEPSGRANARPMTGSAKQSILRHNGWTDRFVAIAPVRKRSAFVAGNDEK